MTADLSYEAQPGTTRHPLSLATVRIHHDIKDPGPDDQGDQERDSETEPKPGHGGWQNRCDKDGNRRAMIGQTHATRS